MNRKIFFPFLILLFITGTSSGQNLNSKLDEYLTSYFTLKNVPSISAGLLQNGKIQWLQTIGSADVENSVPATPTTLYRIASISKSITAVAVMQLVEQGKINLDADARKYIPYFPAKKWKFTVRQLLSHTSGIRDYKKGEFDSKEYFASIKDVVKYLAKDTLQYEPGTRYVYSTLAYNLLAAVVEEVSGMSFQKYLKEKIFEPAGMTLTYLEIQSEIMHNRAHGYTRNIQRKLINAPLADLSIKHPGGGIISTAEDLLKFASSILDGKLIKSSTLDTMLIPLKLKNGDFKNYGLGFTIGTDENGRRFFSHSGGGTGFVSLLIFYPAEKMAAVHLTNLRDRNLDFPASVITSIALNARYEMPKASLADYLVSITLQSGIDSALTAFEQIITDSTSVYNKSEDELLLFGSDLYAMKNYTAAIKYYRFLLADNQSNVRMLIALADTYNADGNTGFALNNYRKALRVDPLNDYALKMIRKLEGRN